MSRDLPARPLRIDFGYFVTLKEAAKIYGASFFRLLAWSVVSAVSAGVICALPILLGAANFREWGGETWQGLLAGVIAVVGMVVFHVLNSFLLTPAGCVIICDQAIREERATFTESLGRAVAGVAVHAGSLSALFLVYTFLLILFLLPGLLLAFWLFEASPAAAILALLGFVLLGSVFLLVTSMLALPALLLEEEGASNALLRSWQLSTQGLSALVGIALTFLLVQSTITIPFVALGLAGLGGLVHGALGLFLPAIMVAAYHGLAAEDARIVGRS
ncbi:MAG: hypothetical protein JKY65_05990 [Planctomycetes bacterium]|nr:hypothetical protein [Planctomycetota bacterium]